MKNNQDRDVMFLKLLFKSDETKVTDDEVAYFRENPDEIEAVTAPVNVHKYFLWVGTLLGILCVAFSKFLFFSGILDSWYIGLKEFTIDIIFEIGVALIGAAVTAYLLGILLNRQQENATKWRAELRRRIDESQIS